MDTVALNKELARLTTCIVKANAFLARLFVPLGFDMNTAQSDMLRDVATSMSEDSVDRWGGIAVYWLNVRDYCTKRIAEIYEAI